MFIVNQAVDLDPEGEGEGDSSLSPEEQAIAYYASQGVDVRGCELGYFRPEAGTACLPLIYAETGCPEGFIREPIPESIRTGISTRSRSGILRQCVRGEIVTPLPETV